MLVIMLWNGVSPLIEGKSPTGGAGDDTTPFNLRHVHITTRYN